MKRTRLALGGVVVLWAFTALACNDGKGGEEVNQELGTSSGDEPAEAEDSDEPPEAPLETKEQEHAEVEIVDAGPPVMQVVPVVATPIPKSVEYVDAGFFVPDAAPATVVAVAKFWDAYPVLPPSIVLPLPEGVTERCEPAEVMLTRCKAQISGDEPSRAAYELCVMENCDKTTAEMWCKSHAASNDGGVGDAGVVSAEACVDNILAKAKQIRKCEADNGRWDMALKGVQLNPLMLSRITMCSKQPLAN